MGLLKSKRDGKVVAYRLDKAAVILGSGENCNIRVPDAGLVTRHCQILKMENGYVLRDMSGDAGTYVNGKKVKEHLLCDRDLIQVGKERFTFSESAGENTARVAVSMAPAAAPAKSGATARVAAAPAPARSGNTGRIAPPSAAEAPRKTDRVETGRNTGRIASPPAAVEAPGRSTQRVNKPPTGRTAAVQKSTGRIEQGTKKITARSAAAMGYSTQRSTFAMPATRKGRLMAVGGVLLILAIGGVFYGINAGRVHPDEVKATMIKEWDTEVKKLKPDQAVEMDTAMERILAEHEPVRKYVNELYTKFEKEHQKVHQIAAELKKAAKDVKPFLDKYAALKGKPADLKAQAQTLYDECKSLIDSYGLTAHGDKLREILEELKKVLEDRGPTWTEKIVGLQRDALKRSDKNEFAQALKDVNAFGAEFKESEDAELHKKLEDTRGTIKRKAEAAPKKIKEAVAKLMEEKKKDEALKLLQEAKEGLEGFPQPLEKIEAEIALLNASKK